MSTRDPAQPAPAQGDSQSSTTPALKNKRLLMIIGSIVGGTLLLGCCCCTGVSAIFLSWGGTGSGQKLVGKWEGKENVFGQEVKVSVEFKSNGRFSAVDGLGDTWTGTWKVNLVEGNVYHLHLVYDQEPDDVKGWTVTFKDNDTITLAGFMGITPTLKRKR